ncbi:thiamine phosphate synthase [Blastochloris sulfoviridis]|uniref:Thiamine phosphate synthase n=2 Tax=Blastochloris sulfoviridis TaxID=50712 RepID=A0A5M6I5G2_9HYPH|nr:thiamine phosphate synthase [Blastochloris sulfoviridis]
MVAKSGVASMRTRLYLITPVIADADAFIPALTAALEAAEVAAVRLRLADADERTLINRIRHIAPLVQEASAALLVDGRPDLVARSGADGAHVTGVGQLQTVRGTLPAERIVGVGGVRTRHDAMTAGESGADYVMFGEPDLDGTGPPPESVIERTAWWAEIFEPPCVAYAADIRTAAALAEAGADFVALGDAIWNDPRGAAAAMRDAAASLTRDKVP